MIQKYSAILHIASPVEKQTACCGTDCVMHITFRLVPGDCWMGRAGTFVE